MYALACAVFGGEESTFGYYAASGVAMVGRIDGVESVGENCACCRTGRDSPFVGGNVDSVGKTTDYENIVELLRKVFDERLV